MADLATLRRKLETVFPQAQADVLADVISQSYANLVTVSDFNELKEIVRDLGIEQKKLAEAQQRTELHVEELAQAQKRTEERVEELAQAQKRTEERVEELAQAQKRTEQRVEELAQAQKRTEQRLEELAAVQKEAGEQIDQLSREMRSLARQVGGLSEAFGGSLESFAIDLVPELLEKYWQMVVEEAGQAEFTQGNKRVEVDLFIRGKIGQRAVVVLGEVKSNLTESEVESFLRLVRQLCSEEPELREVECRVLFFGYRANAAARKLIKDNGAFMVFTHGKIL